MNTRHAALLVGLLVLMGWGCSPAPAPAQVDPVKKTPLVDRSTPLNEEHDAVAELQRERSKGSR
ncbi:MAG: hypothetical protein K1X67_13890 [Fimbriimonadaceae bacterium]|nr:hypothetical protein [Fimbriimonadaceae bacterium]